MPAGGGKLTCVIPNGAKPSSAVDLNGFKAESVLLPTLDSGTLEIQGSNDGTNFSVMKDQTPAQVGVWATNTGGFFLDGDIVAKFYSVRYLRFVSSVNQTADRTIEVYVSRL